MSRLLTSLFPQRLLARFASSSFFVASSTPGVAVWCASGILDRDHSSDGFNAGDWATMWYLNSLLQEYPFLFLPHLALALWMLVDAHRRGMDYFWYFIIFFVPIAGPLAYFFLFKIQDFHGWSSLFQPKVAMHELRYRAEQTPTLANHLALAQRLIEQKYYAEALPLLEKAHPMEPDHSQVMYSLAVCYKESGQADKSKPLLERIISRDRTWSDYAAWRLLIETKETNGDKGGALTTCQDLVKLAPSLRHRCILAEHLLEAGKAEEARQLLDQALQDHYYAPGPLRRRNRRWAGEARRLQKQC
jgi:hypothetical protein